jgi:hypothetical protein
VTERRAARVGLIAALIVVAERARQTWLGLVPTVLALAGAIALGILGYARRSAALAVLPLTAVAFVTAYVVFAVRFPSTDGDTIKATYLLMALPAAVISAGFTVDALLPRGRAWAVATGVVLVVLVALQLPFLVL